MIVAGDFIHRIFCFTRYLGVFEGYRVVLAFAAIVLLPCPASADLPNVSKECAVISDADKRIVCYDALAEEAALKSSEGSKATKQGWRMACGW